MRRGHVGRGYVPTAPLQTNARRYYVIHMPRVIACIVGLLLVLRIAAAQDVPTEPPSPEPEANAPGAESESEPVPLPPVKPTDAQNSICMLLESAARAHGLPVEFFARVIWQESRFRADAVGPVT